MTGFDNDSQENTNNDGVIKDQNDKDNEDGNKELIEISKTGLLTTSFLFDRLVLIGTTTVLAIFFFMTQLWALSFPVIWV